MKKTFIHFAALAALIFTAPAATAQFAKGDYQSAELLRLPKTTTLVAFTGESTFDSAFKAAVVKYWKETPVEFLSQEAALKKGSSTKYSLLMPVNVTITTRDFTSGIVKSSKSTFLALTLGSRKALADYTVQDFLAYSVFDNEDAEKDFNAAAYRAGLMVANIQNALELIKSQKFQGSIVEESKFWAKNYNGGIPKIKNRVLLINRAYLNNELTEADIAKNYPFPYKIVDAAEIAPILEEGSFEYAVLVKTTSQEKHIFVMDAGTGKPMYFTVAQYGNTLDKSDLKTLAKAFK
ncbi:MAG: hypothetical protein M3Q97_03960 [Bacteroidota bacterium]|nr:hypothetical protein [Bacteroidota bacterium]